MTKSQIMELLNPNDYYKSMRVGGTVGGSMYGRLVALASKTLYSRDAAEEAVARAVTKVLRNIEKPGFTAFAAEGQVYNYAVKALRHSITDVRRIRADRADQPFEGEELGRASSRQDTQLDQKERLSELDTVLEQLPSHQRKVWKLREIEGLSHREIAERLGVTVTYSTTTYQRAKRKLRWLLASNQEDVRMELEELELQKKKVLERLRRK